MALTIVLYVVGVLLVLVGLAGLVLPAMPGAPVVLVGILAVAWADGFTRIGLFELVVTGARAAPVSAVDRAVLSRRPNMPVIVRHVLVVALAFAAHGVVPADSGVTRSDEEPVAERERGDSGWLVQPAPAGDVYPPYLADPQHAGFSVQLMSFSCTRIEDSGTDRFGLKLGGRFGLFRMHPPGDPDRGFQVSIEAGFHGQFDNDHSQDNIGWDGVYGLMFTLRTSRVLAFKLGLLHTSSHVGDEYAERTGRTRINYTREELVVGISGSMGERWRAYAEAGWGYDLRTEELQDPGRLQLGLEYDAAGSLWRNRLGWYVATNASTTEERDWEIDLAVQAGISARSADRLWRFGIAYYDGRSWIGEFFQDDERYVSLGVWLDL